MLPEIAQNFHTVFTRTIPLLIKYRIMLLFATGGLIFFIYGLISLIGSNTGNSAITFDGNTDGKEQVLSATASAEKREILIDVSGAVAHPGVYRIPVDSRIKDALIAGGGLSENADRDYVSKNINLAQKLIDGTKIYVPKLGESSVGIKSSGISLGSNNLAININTASLSELDTLSGVGAVTAQKIIDNRPYNTIEELVSKKVVSKSVFEKIKEKIAVY